MKKFGAVALILLFSALVFSQSLKTTKIKKIDSYVKSIDALIEKNPKKFEVFADVSESEKPRWRKFKSEAALESFRENTAETYQIAYVWRKDNKVVGANFTLFSESGDWAHYVFYRFRPDGTLAKIEAELRTFYGNFVALQNFYFDEKGRLLLKNIEYRNMKTDERIQPAAESLEANRGLINGIDYYKRVSKLPFAFLLRTH